MTAQLDMVGIAVGDMGRALSFYRALGLEIAEGAESEDHVETVSGGMRLAWDTVEMIRSFMPEFDDKAGNRIEIAFKCESAEDVDATYRTVVEAGFIGFKEPWDAFWGQRYATLEDPDGNHISLFA